MISKTMKNIEYTFIVVFLLLGLLLSSIGVTFCRYQVEGYQDLIFKIRGAGDYYVFGKSSSSNVYNDDSLQWQMNHQTNTLHLDFKVTNTIDNLIPESNNHFYVRIVLSENVNIKMGVTDLAGKEVYYQGKATLLPDNTYEYCFVDYNNKELKLELQGKQISSHFISLQMQGTNEAFLSEVSIVDATYDIDKNKDYAVAEKYPLEVTSNYLSSNENYKVFIDNTLDVTLTSNTGLNSQITLVPQSQNVKATINGKTSLDMNISPDIENKVTLNVTSSSTKDEAVTMVWTLINQSGEIVEVLKADFVVKGNMTQSSEEPVIIMDYINNQKNFDKYTPLKFSIMSDRDTPILLKEGLFPKGTKYSLDNGNYWYVLSKQDMIELSLKKDVTQNVIIDFKDSEMVFDVSSITYNIYAIYNDEVINTLQMTKQKADITLLDIVDYKMGVINNNILSMTLNHSNFDIEVMFMNNGIYDIIDRDAYFTFSSTNNLTYKIATKDVDNIPKGIYKIKLTQKHNNIVVVEKELTFFYVDM